MTSVINDIEIKPIEEDETLEGKDDGKDEEIAEEIKPLEVIEEKPKPKRTRPPPKPKPQIELKIEEDKPEEKPKPKRTRPPPKKKVEPTIIEQPIKQQEDEQPPVSPEGYQPKQELYNGVLPPSPEQIAMYLQNQKMLKLQKKQNMVKNLVAKAFYFF